MHFLLVVVFFEGFIDGEPICLVFFHLLYDPILDTCVLCLTFQLFKIIQIIKIIPKAMNSIYMLLEIFIFSLAGRLLQGTHKTFIPLLMVNLLFYVPELSEFVDDDGCNEIRKEDIKVNPIDGIREESSIVTISVSRGSLANDSLSK